MIQAIERGAYVKHKTLTTLNGGLRMSVADINEETDEALVSYFDFETTTHKEKWFPFADLIVEVYGDIGFRPAGQ